MFLLSKILGLIGQPGNLAVLVLLAGAPLLFTGWRRLGRALIAASALALALAAVLPVDAWLTGLLEDRFPFAPPPAHVDGIVVLGGALSPELSEARGQPTVPGAAGRIFAMATLIHRYPGARVVYSGGSGDPLHPEAVEAPLVQSLLAGMGCDLSHVTFEAKSRNTRENALFSRDLMQPKPGEVWLLVTSAVHMPRAVGVFRAAGWPVLPYPVDYATPGGKPPLLRFHPSGLWGLVVPTHELEGLVYYRLRGWTDALLPSP